MGWQQRGCMSHLGVADGLSNCYRSFGEKVLHLVCCRVRTALRGLRADASACCTCFFPAVCVVFFALFPRSPTYIAAYDRAPLLLWVFQAYQVFWWMATTEVVKLRRRIRLWTVIVCSCAFFSLRTGAIDYLRTVVILSHCCDRHHSPVYQN